MMMMMMMLVLMMIASATKNSKCEGHDEDTHKLTMELN